MLANRHRTLLALTLAGALAAPILLGAGCAAGRSGASGASDAASLPEWTRFERRAARFGAVLEVPDFPATPEALTSAVDETLAGADAAFEVVAGQDPAFATFHGTLEAMDDASFPVVTTLNTLWLMKETNPDGAMREAATAEALRVQAWLVRTQYREDLYRVVSAFNDLHEAGKRSALGGPEAKLLRDTMRDYRRAGMTLDSGTRARVEELQNQLAALASRFDANVTNANVALSFTREDLEGFSDEMLARYADGEGAYTLRATVTPEFVAVMENAAREETRRRMKAARYSVAMEENLPILDEIVGVREEIASLLGYPTWADYQIEPKMAKTYERALSFVADMTEGLGPKFDDEIAVLGAMKGADAKIEIWDFRYYQNRLLKENFDIDSEALRAYFPFDRCLEGMFGVYEEIFGLEFTQVQPTNAWAEGVTLWVATDSASGAPLGMFYLDMFPREGKYNHFAQFDIIPGKRLRDGKYERPVVALVCNFTAPTEDAPSLISHDELQTLFHEFGHALHSILTQAGFVAQSGTNVPRDFVEAPSQMLEAWTWSPEVLDRFAGHWQNPADKVPAATLARMKEARLATIGVHYRRQLALATGDLRLHAGAGADSATVVNRAFADVFLPVPDGTAMAAYWGHLTGYDAGYYGYAWADSIAADLESRFEGAPGGLMDIPTGMALRREVYSVGGSREIDESIEAFLGRERSLDPFLRKVGILEAEEVEATPAPGASGAPAQWDPATRMWTLRPGDTLAGIAKVVYGDSDLWMHIASANRDRDITALVAGEQISVPPADTPRK